MYLGRRGNLHQSRQEASHVLAAIDAAIVSSRPDALSNRERAHRNRLLEWVNTRGFWIKCECCPESSKTWLYTRRTKEGYTVVRHSSNFEHAPTCAIRTWRSGGGNVPPDTPESLFHEVMEMTRIGRLHADDGENGRITQQYRSIRLYSRQAKYQAQKTRILTHPKELSRLRGVAPSNTTKTWAILLATTVNDNAITLPTGYTIKVPVKFPRHVVSAIDGPWLTIVHYDTCSRPVAAYANPVISASNITPIASPIERTVVATLRQCLRYWEEHHGVQIIAQRALRNGRPSWCLARITTDGHEKWLADVVITEGLDWAQLRNQYGQRCHFVAVESTEPKAEMRKLRRVMTRLILENA